MRAYFVTYILDGKRDYNVFYARTNRELANALPAGEILDIQCIN